MHAFLFHPLCWQLWSTLGKAPFPHNRESLNKTSLYWVFFLPCFTPFSLILNLWDPIPKSSTCTQMSVEALLLGSSWWHSAWPLFLILCWIAKAPHPGLLVKPVVCNTTPTSSPLNTPWTLALALPMPPHLVSAYMKNHYREIIADHPRWADLTLTSRPLPHNCYLFFSSTYHTLKCPFINCLWVIELLAGGLPPWTFTTPLIRCPFQQ